MPKKNYSKKLFIYIKAKINLLTLFIFYKIRYSWWCKNYLTNTKKTKYETTNTGHLWDNKLNKTWTILFKITKILNRFLYYK